MPSGQIELVDISRLTPIEGYGPKRALWLKDKILSEGTWSVPLKVERSRFLIMDGHHRFEAAKSLGLRRIPAQLFSYTDVEVYSLRKNIEVTPQVIFNNHDNGVIFPYKTAKHVFPTAPSNFEGVELNALR